MSRGASGSRISKRVSEKSNKVQRMIKKLKNIECV